MPICAYRCAACGHAKDVVQKIYDPPLADCPACGAPRFEKQVTAARSQLKGSGWYAADFRNNRAAKSEAMPEAKTADPKPSGETPAAPAPAASPVPAATPPPVAAT